MNEKVLHTLEFDKIQQLLADHAAGEETKKRCLSLLPLTDRAAIEELQQTTADALSRIYKNSSLSLVGIVNVHGLLKRLDIGSYLSGEELLQICSLLEVAKRAKAYDRSDRSAAADRTSRSDRAVSADHTMHSGRPTQAETAYSVSENGNTDTLSPLFSQIEPLTPLLTEIRRCILSAEEVADDASPGLFKIRKSIRGMNDRIHGQLTSIMNNSTMRTHLQDAVITMRDGRYCLPVKSEAKSQVPGMVHDQSSSGSTLFIEPMAVVNLNNELKELFIKEKDEINAILAELSNRVAENSAAIETDYQVLCELDFIFAKANLAKDYNGMAPTFNEEGHIHIRRGRHPFLDAKKAVPIDVRLGKDYRQLIVTGPNTGGKTVSLKTVGLLTLMGQAGLHIPAGDRSELSVFEEVFADIGDEQSIEQNLSTFSSHMKNIIRILEKADSRSLVLFDELCAGTDPTEGAALAISILHRLHQYDAVTMATTHYSELKVYALTTPGVENACCEFDVQTLSPTYRLLIGIPGKSNAFAISSKLGLEDALIEDAKARMSKQDADLEDLLSDLESSRQTIEKEQTEIEQYKLRIEELKRQQEAKGEKLDQSRDKILREANEKAYQILKEAKDLADETIRNFNKYGQGQASMSQMEKERTQLRNKLAEKEKHLSGIKKPKDAPNHNIPKKLQIGDSVKVLSMNVKGTVHTLPNAKGDLYVQMGILRSQVNIRDLVLLEESTSTAKSYVSGKSSIKMNKSATISTEINLIGKTVDEALPLLDKYLDDAYIAHLPSVRIVHGKGTGALRTAVHNHLKRTKYVKSFHLGEFGEGDAGVTIANFE